ncbi:hypothetical protein [Pseudomonas tolaasii]|jgi:uncharacterized protein YgiM (DUF1202 family)|uniref:hypothetical protein n=1 Tax=Pseudomonas tolaasii TaxID=29442 RepID=UPI001C52A334|nr:hypothetical protein [Pseudomonas tolaasii]QXQ16639.1 hypothetical protein I7845_17190 [Pseudomonas tolaasii]
MKGKAISQSLWHDATEHSNELFKEADRLDDVAYELLNDAPTSEEAAHKFHVAKNEADEKRIEARAAWEEARSQLQNRRQRGAVKAAEISRRTTD